MTEVLRGKGNGQKVQGRVSLNRIINPGDVLVCQMTDPSMLDQLLLAGAVVTDEGGALCHAAIVATDMGLPFVVGTKTATTTLKDGDIVEVDPVAGTVTVLS